jgi:hypothetical protein
MGDENLVNFVNCRVYLIRAKQAAKKNKQRGEIKSHGYAQSAMMHMSSQ